MSRVIRRVARAFNRFDLDRFLQEITMSEILEWNAYLNEEAEEMARGEAMADFAVNRSANPEPAMIEDPAEIAKVFASFSVNRPQVELET
jgi:hypothetical protein